MDYEKCVCLCVYEPTPFLLVSAVAFFGKLKKMTTQHLNIVRIYDTQSIMVKIEWLVQNINWLIFLLSLIIEAYVFAFASLHYNVLQYNLADLMMYNLIN